MAKNSAQDLIDNLFETLEDLNDQEKMKNPVVRERVMQIAEKKAMVAKEITNAAKAQFSFIKEFGGQSSFLKGDNKQVEGKKTLYEKGGENV